MYRATYIEHSFQQNKKIQNLGRLKKLENLYLDKNLIENYDSICDILECPSITVVKLFVT